MDKFKRKRTVKYPKCAKAQVTGKETGMEGENCNKSLLRKLIRFEWQIETEEMGEKAVVGETIVMNPYSIHMSRQV